MNLHLKRKLLLKGRHYVSLSDEERKQVETLDKEILLGRGSLYENKKPV